MWTPARAIILLLLTLLLAACQESVPASPTAGVSSPVAAQASATPRAPAATPTAQPPAATATPEPSATATPNCYPRAAALPFATPRSPLTLDPAPVDLEGVVAALPAILGRYPGDLGALYAVLAQWGTLYADEPLREVDLDGDGVPEVVLQLLTSVCDCCGFGHFGLAVLAKSGSGYTASDSFLFPYVMRGPRVPFVGDLTDDGRIEFALEIHDVGAHTSTTLVYVFAFRDGKLLTLSPEPIEMASADLQLADRNGDGRIEIVLHGGMYGSIGAGPPQTRAETYAWDGQGFQLIDTVYDPSPYRVHAIFDGDRALRKGDTAAAIANYTSAITNPDLLPWQPWEHPEIERADLEAFARYRLVTVYALLGNQEEAAKNMEALGSRYAGHPAHALAEEFWVAWQPKGDIASGCAAARAYAEAHPEVLESVSGGVYGRYGYGNPTYTVDDICFVH